MLPAPHYKPETTLPVSYPMMEGGLMMSSPTSPAVSLGQRHAQLLYQSRSPLLGRNELKYKYLRSLSSDAGASSCQFIAV